VSAFYVSNVESYLQRNGVWPAFCGNVASMPLDDTSIFIRPPLGGAFYMANRASITSVPIAVNLNGTTTVVTPTQPEFSRLVGTLGLMRTSPFSGMAAETAGCK